MQYKAVLCVYVMVTSHKKKKQVSQIYAKLCMMEKKMNLC